MYGWYFSGIPWPSTRNMLWLLLAERLDLGGPIGGAFVVTITAKQAQRQRITSSHTAVVIPGVRVPHTSYFGNVELSDIALCQHVFVAFAHFVVLCLLPRYCVCYVVSEVHVHKHVHSGTMVLLIIFAAVGNLT